MPASQILICSPQTNISSQDNKLVPLVCSTSISLGFNVVSQGFFPLPHSPFAITCRHQGLLCSKLRMELDNRVSCCSCAWILFLCCLPLLTAPVCSKSHNGKPVLPYQLFSLLAFFGRFWQIGLFLKEFCNREQPNLKGTIMPCYGMKSLSSQCIW